MMFFEIVYFYGPELSQDDEEDWKRRLAIILINNLLQRKFKNVLSGFGSA